MKYRKSGHYVRKVSICVGGVGFSVAHEVVESTWVFT